MRLSTIVTVAAVFGLAAGGAYFSARAAASWVESNTVSEVGARLQLDGFDWASVQANGLEVILDGEAPSEAARFKALSSVGSVVDATRIFDNFSIAESNALATPEFSIEILRNDIGISLIGLIPAATDREGLIEQINRRAPGVPVSDFLENADYAVPEKWDDAVDFGITALGLLERTKITIGEESVAVAASTNSEEEKRRLEANIARRAPDGIQTSLSLNAPRPVIAPFIMRFQIDGDQARLDACSADGPETAKLILQAASSAGLEGKNECRQGLGVPTPEWSMAAAKAITAVGELGGGSVTLSDVNLGLVAVPGTDQAKFDAVVAGLKNDLPEVFTVSATLPELRDPNEEKPIEFTATRSPEGALQLRGALVDTTSQKLMDTFVRAKFGSAQISKSLEVNPELPSGWTIRALSGLEALSALESGFVEVTDEKVLISGRSGDPNVGATLTQTLTERLGQDATFDLKISYDANLDPVANRLDPKECVLEIVQLTESKKITFEPGSTNLDGASRATVDQIAAIMARCPEAEIEISGHTDSQGGEEMNQSLSKDRADAVLGALKLKRVDLKTLVSEGYGETQPIADNGTEAGREANRRIEFRLITATPEPLEDQEDANNEQN